MKNTLKLKSIVFFTIIFYFFNSLAEVNEQCKNKEVKLFVKKSCIYCHKLIKVLKNYDFKYQVTDLAPRTVIATWLISSTKSNTVPYVYLDNKYIGGYSDFMKICITDK